MVRYAMVGNCQTWGVARGIEYIREGDAVTLFNLAELGKQYASEDQLLADLRKYDFVLSQEFDSGVFRGFTPDLLRANVDRLVFFPTIFFSGFHPDMVYVHGKTRAGERRSFVKGATEEYHSALALWGWANRLDVDRTLRLFTGEVFEQLGYFEMWTQAERYLLSRFEAMSFPCQQHYFEWARRGVFMFVNNHPTTSVLADVAHVLLSRCDLKPRAPVRAESYLNETFNHIVWPVYPEVATELGVEGSYDFKCRGEPGTFHYFGLRGFVERCFASYHELDREGVECERLTAWRDDPRTDAFLKSAASRT